MAKESKLIEKDKIERARAAAIQMKTRQKWASHKNEFVLLSINFWFESLSDMPTVNICCYFFSSCHNFVSLSFLLFVVQFFLMYTHIFVRYKQKKKKNRCWRKLFKKSHKILYALRFSSFTLLIRRKQKRNKKQLMNKFINAHLLKRSIDRQLRNNLTFVRWYIELPTSSHHLHMVFCVLIKWLKSILQSNK